MTRNKPQFRIVRDRYRGYEVQRKVWWWPCWHQGPTNTHSTIEAAEDYARRWAQGDANFVKDLGRL